METTTPFADAINSNAPTQETQSQIDILREANSKFKLELIALKEALATIDSVLKKLNKQ